MASPKYPQTFRNEDATVSTANTGRDGTGTIATVLTAVAAGTEVYKLTLHAQGNVTDGMLRIFVYDGTTNRLIDEIPVVAIDVSATRPAWKTVWFPPGGRLLLPSASFVLKVSTHNAETFNAIAEGMDY